MTAFHAPWSCRHSPGRGGGGSRVFASPDDAQVTLRAALLTSGPTVPRWLAQGIARAETERLLRVVGNVALDSAEAEAAHGWLAAAAHAAQRRLEGLDDPAVDALWARVPWRAVRRGDPLAPGERTPDICLDTGVPAWRAREAPSRLGTLSIEVCGVPGDLGLHLGLVERCLHLRVVLRARQASFLLAEARLAPPERWSLRAARTRAERAWTILLAKALRRLERNDLPAARHAPPEPPATPGPGALAAYAWRRCHDAALGRWWAWTPERAWLAHLNWFLAYRTDPARFIREGASASTEGLRFLLPPHGHSWADPCVFTKDGVDHLFFEDWQVDLDRGTIGWMRREGATFGPAETVLIEGHHLSYPCVFEAEGEVFMVPESAADGTVSLYAAREFPRRWRRDTVLLEGQPASDATLHRADDGRWWMFVMLGPDRQHELHAYWAERVRGPWHPHALNPVKLDARSARPAGKLFRRGGRWIRPAQDCSVSYGGALTLNHLVALTPERFEERALRHLAPPWPGDFPGLHTLAHGAGLEVIDGRVRGTPACRFPFLATSDPPARAWPGAAALLPRPRAAR